MSAPAVSILIPTLNAEPDLERLLPALELQAYSGRVERVAVDSSSRDATVRRLEAAAFRVEIIDRSCFGHGRTRNQLASLAKGELLVFLSQDAVPDGPEFLEALVAPFADEAIAGVMARVLPHEDDDILTQRTVLAAPEASTEPWEHRGDQGAEARRLLSPAESAERLRFNNVASAIRASVLREHPFPDVPFGEDVAWAARVLDAGYALRFEPAATVRHAHRYGPSSAYRRYRTDAEFQSEMFGLQARPTLRSVARGVLYECREDLRFARRSRGLRGLGDCIRSPFLRSAQVLGQYMGGRRRSMDWSSLRRRSSPDASSPRPH